MSAGVEREDCFNTEVHKPHRWTYSAAGSSAQFDCSGVKK